MFQDLMSRIRRLPLWCRPLVTVMIVAAVMTVVVAVFAIAPTAVSAQGPTTSCFETMLPGATAQTIEFHAGSGTYTVTLSANTDVCVQSSIGVLSAFVGQANKPYAVDNVPVLGMSANGVFTGTMAFDLASADELSLELTPYRAPVEMIVWKGTLKTTVAPVVNPVANARDMVFMGPGSYTTNWVNGNDPKWGPFTCVGACMDLRIQTSDPFTMTSDAGYSDTPAVSCGTDCWSATVPADGVWRSKELKGLYWSDALLGAPGSRVMMPAPTPPTAGSPAVTAPKKGGGGGTQAPAFYRPGGGFRPNPRHQPVSS